jgi:hypothetical protein
VEDFVQMTATVGKGSWAAIIPGNEGASVECTWDFCSSNDEAPCDELRFMGPKGSLRMAGMSPAGPIDVLDADGNVVRELCFEVPEHTAQPLIQAVTNDLRGIVVLGTTDVLSYGDNAIRTNKVLDTVLHSYYGGREIGYWTREDSWPGRST